MNPRYSDRELLERHSIPEPNSGCRLWMSATNRHGYGIIGRVRGEGLAHRLSWRAFRGPIPEGICVLHRCDVRCCINPAHLFLGTNKDNSMDMAQKGRHRGSVLRRGEQSPFAKLTWAAVQAIRSSTESHAELARRYGVSTTTVWLARTRQKWKVA